MEFDSLLTQDAHEEGAEVRIFNPEIGEYTDVYIDVLGPDSKAWRSAVKSMTRELIAKRATKEVLTEDEEITMDIKRLVAVSVGWKGVVKNGQPYDFTKERCEELYTKSPHVRDQVDRFIGDYKNFTKG